MECNEIIFSQHAVQRMFARGIATFDIRIIIESGETITTYPEDQPFPSYLLLGWVNNQPVHVVLALDETGRKCYIITAYFPDPSIWSSDFRTKRAL
jgi:hypothetical protein